MTLPRLRAALAAAVAAPLLCATVAPSAGAAPPRRPADLAQQPADAITAAGAESALVLIRDGKEVVTAASGNRAAGSPAPARPDDRFRAGSATKSLVATVVLQLWEDGTLDLNAPLGQYLPGVLPYGDAVTIRQLLQHTGGVPDYVDDALINNVLEDPAREWTPDEILRRIVALPRDTASIGRYAYASSNYVLLGRLVEHLTAQPLDRVLTERVLRPASMRHTTFPTTGRISGPHVHGYLPTSATVLDVTTTSPSWAWATGDMITTTSDLAEMQTTVPVGPGEDYGLGLQRWDFGCGTAWGHTGSIPGYTTLAWTSPNAEEQTLVVVPLSVEVAPEHPVTTAWISAAVTTWCSQ
jgi:D-alanyl-D-alanine carboxypeptidase